jgi:lysyl oxidase
LRTRAWIATVCLVALGALAAVHAPAHAQLQPSPLLNPCPTHHPVLRCPDLVMRRPYDLRYERVGSRIHLRAGNTILNVGTGPMELLGKRSSARSMRVTQRIHAVDGTIWSFPTRGLLFFKHVPGYGTYWKFRNAARFELWSLDSAGNLLHRVRIGPKLIYCLRDLNKRFSNRFSPPDRHFPGCSQNPAARQRILGTSVGWSDDYPASYYEQWVDVTGLRGQFAFFQVVDPLDQLYESNEQNNRSPIVYLTLPPGSAGGGSAGGGYAY